MAASLHTTLRNNRAAQVTSFVGTSAKLRIYTASFATLISEHVCSASAFAGSPSSGVITWNPVGNAIAAVTGNAATARVYQSDGTTLAINNLTVTDTSGSGDVKLDQTGTSIVAGQTVVIDSGSWTEGNA